MVNQRTKSAHDDVPSGIEASDLFEILNQFNESIVIFDDKWRYLFINKTGWEVLGMSKGEVIGKNVWMVLPHLKDTKFEVAAKSAMRTQQVISIEEYYPHRQMWGRVKFYPTAKMLMVKIEDITDLRNEQQINDQLLGDLQPAMEIYWSERNLTRRKGKQS